MKKYPKEFEKYWYRADHHIPGLEPWQEARVKHKAYLAWQSGRRKEREEWSSYGMHTGYGIQMGD